MSKHLSLQDQTTEFLLYTAPNGAIKVEVLLSKETIWLTQKRMAELFGVGVPAVSKHLKNIFESNELAPDSVISILETTADDGKNYQTQYYNLDAVISVGYRVNSAQATQFRIWATQLIKEYIIKGFAMDDERLKNGRFLNCWSGCALSAPASGASINRLPTFFPNAVSTTTQNPKLPVCFTPMCRTSFILQLQAIPRQKSSRSRPMPANP